MHASNGNFFSNGNIFSVTTRRGRMINSVMKATYTMKYAERTIKLNHSNNSSHPKSFLDRQNFVLSFFRLFSLNCMSKVVPLHEITQHFFEYNLSSFNISCDRVMDGPLVQDYQKQFMPFYCFIDFNDLHIFVHMFCL